MKLLSVGVVGVTLACGACAIPSADRAPAPVAGPDHRHEEWRATVSGRIAAKQRSIHGKDGVFAADLRAVGLHAQLDAGGVVFSGPEGEAWSLRTAAWGREQALVPFRPSEPELGECTVALGPDGRCIRRLEYAAPGVTEWWVGLEHGVEQGWTLDEPPPGDGPVVVDVELHGVLAIDGGGDSATVTDADGRAWNVAGVEAWDADGEPLAARLVVTATGFRIRVDDTGATWPVTIDPEVTLARAWTADGEHGDSGQLQVVSGVGDVNGDGYDDVIVGAPEYTYGGHAYVYHGSSSGLQTAVAVTLSDGRSTYFGAAVAGAGDVNGDGYDDVIVGAFDYDTGRAYVFHGSPGGVGTVAATTLEGFGTGHAYGRSVAGVGDVDGDGYDDVMVGAYLYDSSRGRAYVYMGSASGVALGAVGNVSGEAEGDAFAWSLAGAGDVNEDGFDDVIVGAARHDSYTGRAYVYLGSSTGLVRSAATTLGGPSTYCSFGQSVSGAGDVNADGYDDVIVSASDLDVVYLYEGSASGLGTTPATTLAGGGSISGARDVNGDGYADVVVGAPSDSSGVGQAYVYEGSATGLATGPTTTLIGETVGDSFGRAVAGVGDVDGDGHDDVMVVAEGYHSWLGRAYLYRGSSAGVATGADTTITGETPNFFGFSVSGAGDVNGDGFDDAIVGAYGYDSSAGRVYVYAGSASGLGAGATAITGGEGEYFGYAVSGVGDLDADGYDDVAFGGASAVYVHPGSAGGLQAAPAAVLTGGHYSEFGASVSGAGDVNGDGFGDLVVGAPGYLHDTGRVYVYSGSASGLVLAPAIVLTGDRRDSNFGAAVAGAGDVNGDGYDDVAVGAWESDSHTGQVVVYQGSASGLNPVVVTRLAGDDSWTLFGYSVSAAGDVNADGYDDLLVGAAGWNGRSAGAYLYEGSATGVLAVADFVLEEGAYDQLGYSVSGAGDVNGDGFADVIVGACGDGYGPQEGAALLFHGSGSGLTLSATLRGEAAEDQFGCSVSGAGDVNGDGYDEIIIGAYERSSGAGRAYAYAGYPDGDGDGVRTELDCDDSDPGVGAMATWYVDADSDGFGTAATDTAACDQPSGYVGDDGDCDDGDESVNPAALEICNDIDDDCDGTTDNISAPQPSAWHADADGDGYGSSTTSTATCDPSAGHLRDGSDCDDGDNAVNPAAVEICNRLDDDCDGVIDDVGCEKGEVEGPAGCSCASPGPVPSLLGLAVGGLLLALRRTSQRSPAERQARCSGVPPLATASASPQ